MCPVSGESFVAKDEPGHYVQFQNGQVVYVCCDGCVEKMTANLTTYIAQLPEATDCETAYADQSSCDGDATCSWCESAAVPSGCKTLEDAKSLPPAVFKCDKV